jgi:hypothetical protein
LQVADDAAAHDRAEQRRKQNETLLQWAPWVVGFVIFLLVVEFVRKQSRANENVTDSKAAVANASAEAVLIEARAQAEAMLIEAQARAKEIESKAFRNLTIVSEHTRSVISAQEGGGIVIQPIEVSHLESLGEQLKTALPPAEVPGIPKPKYSPATIKLVSFLERCQIKNLRNRSMPLENKPRQITPAGDFKNSNWRNWAIRHLESEGAVYSLDGVGVFVADEYGTLDALIRAIKTGQIAEPPTFQEEGSELFERNPSLQEG